MSALPHPGHQLPMAVTSKFLVPGGIESLVFGNQIDRENFRTQLEAEIATAKVSGSFEPDRRLN